MEKIKQISRNKTLWNEVKELKRNYESQMNDVKKRYRDQGCLFTEYFFKKKFQF